MQCLVNITTETDEEHPEQIFVKLDGQTTNASYGFSIPEFNAIFRPAPAPDCQSCAAKELFDKAPEKIVYLEEKIAKTPDLEAIKAEVEKISKWNATPLYSAYLQERLATILTLLEGE